MQKIKQKIDAVLPWIGGLETEKELILLSALGGNPDTDKISGGRINLLFVTEPDLFMEQLVNGVRHWAKNVKYAYFNYYPVDPYIALSEQIPTPSIRGQDIIQLVINRDSKMPDYASKAYSYFENLDVKQPNNFSEEIRRLRSIKPMLKSRARQLIIYYYIELRKLEEQQITKVIPVTQKTVVTLKNMAEAEAKLHERNFVLERDVERAVQLMMNTYKKMGFEDPDYEIDLLNENNRVKKGREKMNQLYDNIKKAAIDGYITREKVRRLGRSIKLTEMESDECMKVLQENGYIRAEINDKVRIL